MIYFIFRKKELNHIDETFKEGKSIDSTKEICFNKILFNYFKTKKNILYHQSCVKHYYFTRYIFEIQKFHMEKIKEYELELFNILKQKLIIQIKNNLLIVDIKRQFPIKPTIHKISQCVTTPNYFYYYTLKNDIKPDIFHSPILNNILYIGKNWNNLLMNCMYFNQQILFFSYQIHTNFYPLIKKINHLNDLLMYKNRHIIVFCNYRSYLLKWGEKHNITFIMYSKININTKLQNISYIIKEESTFTTNIYKNNESLPIVLPKFSLIDIKNYIKNILYQKKNLKYIIYKKKIWF